MPSVWDRRLELRPKAERDLIKAAKGRYEELGGFSCYTTRNLTADRFLSEAAADDFLDLFLDFASSGDVPSMRSGYLSVCIRHALTGGEIRLSPYPPRLGRAMDRAAYIQKVIRANGVTTATAEGLLRGLEKGTLTKTKRVALENMLMSEYGAWVTWDRDSKGTQAPFAFMRNRTGYDLRCAMGLPIDDTVVDRRPVLVLEYTSTDVTELLRPSTADAGGFTRFSVREPPPPPDSDWFGLTLPWQDDPENRFDPDDITYPPKRPEALHSRIGFPPGVTCETLPHE